MIENKWKEFRAKSGEHAYSLDRWHVCLQSLRQYLKGWNLKMIRAQKVDK
jgi:hypothetical protein